MQLCVTKRAHPSRLAELEVDLGIEGHQRIKWNRFVEEFQRISHLVNNVDNICTAGYSADRAPAIPEALQAHAHRLSAEVAAANGLTAAVDRFYKSLTPRQRSRADRLLPAVWREFGWDVRL